MLDIDMIQAVENGLAVVRALQQFELDHKEVELDTTMHDAQVAINNLVRCVQFAE